jgi:GNAT superfamily N-acetyltransferase
MWQMERVAPIHANVLRKIADEILAPIYGSQDKAFNEWYDLASNKRAFVPVKEGVIAGGLLSMKVVEGKSHLKIATLLVLEEYKGNGCATVMLDFAVQFAKPNGFSELLVTVSETKPQSIQFFTKNGFEMTETEVGKYTQGVAEHIFMRRL